MGSFLKFEDGPMAELPPVINTGPWPPSKRLAVRLGVAQGAAMVMPLDGVPSDVIAGLPKGTMFYRQVKISDLAPDHPNVFPGATYALETADQGGPLRWSCGEVVQPGETYREHVQRCLEEEPDADDRSDVQ